MNRINHMAKFRTRLGDLMREHDMTRMDIVRKVEVSYPTVKSWETDAINGINGDVIWRMMLLFNLDSIEDLIYLVDDDEETILELPPLEPQT